MTKQNINLLSSVLGLVGLASLAAQLSGCSQSKGIEPSSVYGSLASARKISMPATADRADLVGSVKDSSGRPLKGATVFVYTAKPRTGTSPFCPSCYVDCGKHEVTNASGGFRIPSLARNLIFRLLIVKNGFEPSFVHNIDPLRGKVSFQLQKTELTQAQKARLVRGRVLDPKGQPVVGAVVEPFGVKTAGEGFEELGAINGLENLAITNERGEFHFLAPGAEDSVRIKVSARNLATAIFPNLIAGAQTPSVVNLPWGVTLMGQVHSASGKKIAGAVVQVVPVDRNAKSFTGWLDIATDSEGQFTLYNVPADREYKVCAKMDSLTKHGLAIVAQTVTTGHDDTVTEGINLTVKPAATLSGQVTLTDGKKIPEGTRIMLSRDGTWDNQQLILSPAGKFVFKGVPQEEDLQLGIRVPGYHRADGITDSGFKARLSSIESKKIVSLSLAPDTK